MAYNHDKVVSVVGYDVHYYPSKDRPGEVDSDWEMQDMITLEPLIERYISDCDESEDAPLSEQEKARLRDFVKYCQYGDIGQLGRK